jgi:hypothetical protein
MGQKWAPAQSCGATYHILQSRRRRGRRGSFDRSFDSACGLAPPFAEATEGRQDDMCNVCGLAQDDMCNACGLAPPFAKATVGREDDKQGIGGALVLGANWVPKNCRA